MILEVNGKDDNIPTWYRNSWSALEHFRSMHKYEQVYNVKIITSDNYISHINFPSEADAMLFILRWS